MLSTEQTKGQSVYQHGQSVSEMLADLIEHLADGRMISGWKIPTWLTAYSSQILANLHPQEIRHDYALFHDVGKPFCRVVDEDGKVHFPDHAEVSRQVYLAATGDITVSNLIGHDMVIHTASSDEIDRYCREEWSVQDAMTLLLAALSEVHSNAKLFGGIDSQSFKSKFTKIDRRGKQICKLYFGEAK